MIRKIEELKNHFLKCLTKESLYQEIMAWGRKLIPFEDEWKVEENRVIGCQSLMYLKAEIKDGKMTFSAASDALISAGLAAILIEAYNGATPAEVLTIEPIFLEEIGISSSLTPGRANGLASLYLRMKREAVKHL